MLLGHVNPERLLGCEDTSTLITHHKLCVTMLSLHVVDQPLPRLVIFVTDWTFLVLLSLANTLVPLHDPSVGELLVTMSAPALLPNTMLLKVMHLHFAIIILLVITFFHTTCKPLDGQMYIFEMKVSVFGAGENFFAGGITTLIFHSSVGVAMIVPVILPVSAVFAKPAIVLLDIGRGRCRSAGLRRCRTCS